MFCIYKPPITSDSSVHRFFNFRRRRIKVKTNNQVRFTSKEHFEHLHHHLHPLMAATTIVVEDTSAIESSKRSDLQPSARRQVSLPACVGSRLSNTLRPYKTGLVTEIDDSDGCLDKAVPSQSLNELPNDTIKIVLDCNKNGDESIRPTFRKRQRGQTSTEKQGPSKYVSSNLRRRLTKTSCVYLYLGFPMGHRRRALQNADLIIVHTSTPTPACISEVEDNGEADTAKSTEDQNNAMMAKCAKWQPVAWAHSLPCVVGIPVTLETFSQTHVSISFNIGTRRIGTANTLLAQLSNPSGAPLSVIASGRAVVIGSILTSLYVPPVRRAKFMNTAPGVAIAVRMAPSMRREARHVVHVRLERAALGVTPLPVAEERIIRRGERQAFLAASAEALQFALDVRQAERAELHVVWKGAPKRGGEAFTHGVWRLELTSVAELGQGQLYAMPWCEVAGMPVVMRSLLIDTVDRRNDLWWCIDVTLTR